MADITSGQDVDIISPIGQKVMASSVSVVIASDQSAVPVSGTLALSGTVSTKTALTASAPTFHTAGVASAVALVANANRKGLAMVNTSTAAISLAFGTAAVLYSGLTLLPGSAWTMDEYTFTTAEIRDIASAAASNLAIQEFQ